VAVAVTFAVGGVVLVADAWEAAWRSSLRVAFEGLARAERAEAARQGRFVPEDDEAFATVTGVLRSDASISASGVSLGVEVDEISGQEGQEGRAVRGGLLVTVVGSLGASYVDEWRAGRRVRMPVQLHRPSRYLDPGVPDNERALARGGTSLVGTVKSGALVEQTALGGWWSELAGDARHFARRAIERAIGGWSQRAAAVVTAIVIGDRAGLDDEVRRRLQEAGTYHVIAISGGNIAILAGLLLTAFRVAGCLGRTAMIAAVGLLIAYAAVIDGGASVQRATLMAVVYLGSRAFDQRSPPLNTLWVVAAAVVLVDPLAVADPGFVLTFGATLAILLSQSATQGSELLVVLRSMLVASLAVEALLFPVGALLFSRVTFAGLALNFVAIPLMGLAQVAGMAVVALTIFSAQLAVPAGLVALVGAEGLVRSADLVRFVPSLTYRLAPPAWGVVVLYYVAIGVGWALWRRRSESIGTGEPRAISRVRRTAAGVAALAAIWILASPSRLLLARGDGLLHATFLDVGQGDSVLLRFPRGSTMLVDAGGLTGSSSFDLGDRVVAPVLRAAGIRRLDYLVLTHGDPDHIGGAPAVVREFRPFEVWNGIPVDRSAALAALQLQAEDGRAAWANVYRGHRLSVDGVEVVAEHPVEADWERQRVRNDDSIVLDIRWRDVSLLLTGDIGREVEQALGERVRAAPLRVLKVPHHGSLTSSSPGFLQAVRPDVAVFSAGRSNHFGHPAPAVLQRYADIGAEVFRTDRDGAVTLDTDGYSIDVRTFTNRTYRLRQTPPRKHEDTKVS
jgi:competence protein ComEC